MKTASISNYATGTCGRLLAALAFGLIAAGATVVRGESMAGAFDSANTLYEQAKYSEAAAAYEKLIQTGQTSAAVYFNLGNAFLKAGEIGRAIAAYDTAEEITPRDPDLRANLQFARGQVQGPTLAPNGWQRWLGRLTLNEWTVLAAAVIWCWFGLLSLTQWQPDLKNPVRKSLIGLAVIAVALDACLGFVIYEHHSERTAIVINRNVVARHGPLAESAEAFVLHDGAELTVLDHRDEWLQVALDAHQIGWLQKGEVLLAGQPLH